jgi:methyl-accepting chemotaxis protein
MKSLKLRAKLYAVGLAPLVLVVALGMLIYKNVGSLLQSNNWVVHTYRVMGNANEILALLIDCETGQRGFLVGGDEQFLEPYLAGKDRVFGAIGDLQKVVSDNPTQVNRLREIETLARDLIQKVMEPEIAFRREANAGLDVYQHFRQIQGRTIGKEIFDQIRAAIADVDGKFERAGSAEGRYLAQAITLDLVNMETGQRGFLLTGIDASLEPFHQGNDAFRKRLHAMRTLAGQSGIITESDVARIESLTNQWIERAANPEIEARRAVNQVKVTVADVAARFARADGKQYMDTIRARIADFIKAEADLLVTRREDAVATAINTNRAIVWGVLGTIVIAAILSWLLGRAISKPIISGVAAMKVMTAQNEKVAAAVAVMASGDLTTDIPVDNTQATEDTNRYLKLGDEVGDMFRAVDALRKQNSDLIESIQRMNQNTGNVLQSVVSSVAEVSSGSDQISDASQSLSQGATESAASLEEISASATEIGQQAKANAETAAQANQLASTVKSAAESGTQRMDSLNGAMGAITESSSQIAKIIKAIDDIAFQTNILALNAAVEAARAGRHGKGFAVVAEEVRSLAARSAKAARETSELIEGSVSRVEQGNRIAKETADALAEIVSGIVKVGDLVGEMSAASNEQAQGIAQITQGLGQIDQVTQQNTATAEETAAAAEELSGQAAELRSLIGQFKLQTADCRPQTADRKKAIGTNPVSRNSKPASPKAALPAGGGWDTMPQKKAAAKPASNEEIISLEDKDFGRY